MSDGNQINIGNNNNNILNNFIFRLDCNSNLVLSPRVYNIAKDLQEYGNEALLNKIEEKLLELKRICYV